MDTRKPTAPNAPSPGPVAPHGIEATTASHHAVADAMVPYLRANLRRWLTERAREPDVAGWIYEVSALSGASPWDLDGCADTLLDWLDVAPNIEPLQAIQDRIWREASEASALSVSPSGTR